MAGYVYFMASKPYGTLYLGVTSDLLKRCYEHKNSVHEKSFSAKYDTNTLVYYEAYESIEEAIKREKQLKNWKRQWKIELIEKQNPYWLDLYGPHLAA